MESKPPLPWRDLEEYHCFGCSPKNAAGVALSISLNGQGVSAPILLTKTHESFPGIVHGGIASTILDELMGNLLVLQEKRLCLTVSLHTRFITPLRTGKAYIAEARLVQKPENQKGIYQLEGTILDQVEGIMVTSNGTYKWMTMDQAEKVTATSAKGLAALAPYLLTLTLQNKKFF